MQTQHLGALDFPFRISDDVHVMAALAWHRLSVFMLLYGVLRLKTIRVPRADMGTRSQMCQRIAITGSIFEFDMCVCVCDLVMVAVHRSEPGMNSSECFRTLVHDEGRCPCSEHVDVVSSHACKRLEWCCTYAKPSNCNFMRRVTAAGGALGPPAPFSGT